MVFMSNIKKDGICLKKKKMGGIKLLPHKIFKPKKGKGSYVRKKASKHTRDI